jgi:hypothetical protein
MNKLKLLNSIFSSSLIAISASLFSPLSSAAKDIYGPEINYRNCTQLQNGLNNKNNPYVKYKGFERAKLMRRMYVDDQYIVYCNGGIIIDGDRKIVCRGYIGYTYAPKVGIAHYYGDWGWTNGSPNDGDTDNSSYCRRMK